MIPLSDGAGEVVEVGSEVTRFQVGDRVLSCFFQDWMDGEIEERQMSTALGGSIDGVLAEEVVLHQNGVVHVPSHLSWEQAACLPCAALDRVASLDSGIPPGRRYRAPVGDGRCFDLRFAVGQDVRRPCHHYVQQRRKTRARAQSLGADATINYRANPEWGREVRRLTDGVGADNVIEVGGAGTLEQSLQAARVSGTVSLIGILTGNADNPSPMLALFNRITIRGIYVGSRHMFECLNRAIEQNQLVPVVDQVFGFHEARAAYEQAAVWPALRQDCHHSLNWIQL